MAMGFDYFYGQQAEQFSFYRIPKMLFVLDCFKENTTDVRNVKQYLLAAIYNAPLTIDSYYTAKVSHDMAGGFFR